LDSTKFVELRVIFYIYSTDLGDPNSSGSDSLELTREIYFKLGPISRSFRRDSVFESDKHETQLKCVSGNPLEKR